MNQDQDPDLHHANPAILIAYGACTLSGMLTGLVIGWLIWG